MTLTEMTKEVASNLNMLADDDATIKEGRVTAAGIKRRINTTYRERLFSMFADSFQEDFERETRETSMYSESGTVDAATDDTTLVATTAIFSSGDVGMQIYNADTGELVTIESYASTTQVVVSSDVTAWIGDVIYILQNTYTLGGDAADAREIIRANVSYDNGTTWYKAERLLRSDKDYDAVYTENTPAYAMTTVDVDGISTRAIRFFPAPEDNTAKFSLVYTEKPATLGDSDEPTLNNAGISEILISDATSWGHAQMKNIEMATYWKNEYDKQVTIAIRKYKPIHRDKAPTTELSSYFEAIRNRDI